MTKRMTFDKPLIEQIFDEILSSMKGHAEFDADIVPILSRLSKSGDLVKVVKVVNAIRRTAGKDYESA